MDRYSSDRSFLDLLFHDFGVALVNRYLVFHTLSDLIDIQLNIVYLFKHLGIFGLFEQLVKLILHLAINRITFIVPYYDHHFQKVFDFLFDQFEKLVIVQSLVLVHTFQRIVQVLVIFVSKQQIMLETTY